MKLIGFINQSWKIGLATVVLCAAAATNSRADQAFDRLVSRWKIEREQVVRHITQAWLRGETPESLRGDLMQLSQIESGLATQSGVVLYISAIENPKDVAGSVSAVARMYLKQRGALVDSTEFLRGKTFYVVKERIVPKKAVKSQNYTYGGSKPIDADVVTEVQRKEVRYTPGVASVQ
jgi:hypothetical protein